MLFPVAIISCPENSAASGADCICGAGFEEKDAACKSPELPKDPKCGSLADMPLGLNDYGASFGNKSIDWAKNQIGKSANSCLTGGCKSLAMLLVV